jgi:hypothetical protein
MARALYSKFAATVTRWLGQSQWTGIGRRRLNRGKPNTAEPENGSERQNYLIAGPSPGLTYNSIWPTASEFGYGWSGLFNQRVTPSSGTGGYIANITKGDGGAQP